MSMTYNYSATQNNGQITSSVDGVTGETVTYQYDALKRLASASGKNWGETYFYDGYGNLTNMLPTGTAGAPSLNLTVALDANNVPTNRINATGVGYDANGNQTQGFAGYTFTYDVANRVTAVSGTGTAAYGYDSDNRRIYSRSASGAETICFYGVDGKKLAAYTPGIITYGGFPEVQLSMQTYNVYFLGKLIYAEGNSVQTDRLGSVRSGGPSGLGYQAQYPYGVEYTLTANDREKYATYTRDSATGLDYAMNRYYASQWGRFLSPDPSVNNAGLGSPQSWNRYAYVNADPINSIDPTGLEQIWIWSPPLPDPTPVWGGGGGGGGGTNPIACAVVGLWPGPVPMGAGCGGGNGSGYGGSGQVTNLAGVRNALNNAIKALSNNCFTALGFTQQTLLADAKNESYFDARSSGSGNQTVAQIAPQLASYNPTGTLQQICRWRQRRDAVRCQRLNK